MIELGLKITQDLVKGDFAKIKRFTYDGERSINATVEIEGEAYTFALVKNPTMLGASVEVPSAEPPPSPEKKERKKREPKVKTEAAPSSSAPDPVDGNGSPVAEGWTPRQQAALATAQARYPDTTLKLDRSADGAVFVCWFDEEVKDWLALPGEEAIPGEPAPSAGDVAKLNKAHARLTDAIARVTNLGGLPMKVLGHNHLNYLECGSFHAMDEVSSIFEKWAPDKPSTAEQNVEARKRAPTSGGVPAPDDADAPDRRRA